jgi:AcrR family transcriptional regulator
LRAKIISAIIKLLTEMHGGSPVLGARKGLKMAQQYTRRAIREAFIQMLNQRPLDKITVKDIVAACEINRNTFYYYYTDLFAVLSEIFQSELQKVIDADDASRSWEECFLSAAQFALENRTAIYHVYNSVRRENLEEYLYAVAGSVMNRYVQRESEHIRASESDKRLISNFYQSALTEMVLHWISGGMKEDPEDTVGRIGQLFDGNISLSLRRSEQMQDRW